MSIVHVFQHSLSKLIRQHLCTQKCPFEKRPKQKKGLGYQMWVRGCKKAS